MLVAARAISKLSGDSMMSILIKILSFLSLSVGIFVLFAAALKNFTHRGMAIAGVFYLVGGVLGLYLTSVLPPIVAFIITISIRKFSGEPKDSTKTKTHFQIWWEKYRPLTGPTGEPLNYITVIDRITDMTAQEKEEYIKQKTESNLLWTVLDNGGRKLIRPGKHEGKVVAWWICDMPYSEGEAEVTIDK